MPEPVEDEPPPQLVRLTDKVAPKQHRTKKREDCIANSMASFPSYASLNSRLFVASRCGTVGMAPLGRDLFEHAPEVLEKQPRARAYF